MLHAFLRNKIILTLKSLYFISLFTQAVRQPRDGGRGAIVSWIGQPPALISHMVLIVSRDNLWCTSARDRDRVYFHFCVPPVFSGHVPWHFMTNIALVSPFLLHFSSQPFLGAQCLESLWVQANFTFSSQTKSGRCSNFSSFLYLKSVKYIFYIVEHVF